MRASSVLAIVFILSTICPADTLEDWVEASPEPEDLQAWLDDLRRDPLDLNLATETDLMRLPFFDVTAAKAILEMRKAADGFHGLGEVLRIPILSEDQRLSLRTFTLIRSRSRHPRNESFRVFASSVDSDPTDPIPESWGGRLRMDWRNANGAHGYLFGRRGVSDSEGFRQVAAGVAISSGSGLPKIAAGDFQLESGTGLVFSSAYGMANWLSSTMDLNPGEPRGLSVRPTGDRRSLFRGGAIQAENGPISAIALASYTRLDAAISDSGATRLTEGESSASPELQKARRNQVEERLVGADIRGRISSFRLGVSGYNAHYAPGFSDVGADDVMPRFTGNELQIGSASIQGSLIGADWIAEAGGSNPGGYAHQAALAWSSQRAGIALYQIFADEDFFSPHSKLWGGYQEEPGNNNSTGIRVRTGWAGYNGWIHASIQSTPFRTTTSPLSKSAGKLETRWVITGFRPAEFEVVGSRSWREDAADDTPSEIVRLDRGRIDVTFRPRTEYRIRFEIRSASRDFKTDHSLGTLLFFQIKSRFGSLRTFARLTFYHLDDDDVASQVFENTLPGGYPLVALSGTGRRAAVILSRSLNDFSASVKLVHIRRYTANESDQTIEMAMEISYHR